VVLYDAKTGKPVSTNGDSQSISATLNVGSYYLKFTGDMFWFCPVLPIEFAIAPVANGITVTCPAGRYDPKEEDRKKKKKKIDLMISRTERLLKKQHVTIYIARPFRHLY
jgi:hypothetical protein